MDMKNYYWSVFNTKVGILSARQKEKLLSKSDFQMFSKFLISGVALKGAVGNLGGQLKGP